MNTFDPTELALELRTAETERRGITLPTDRFATFSWSDARATALARDALRRADGDRRIGYKLGWTSAAMRAALGIDRPNWGTLWDSNRIDGAVPRSRFIHPKVEPEIVYVAGEPLAGAVTAADVIGAAAGWAVGLEVVDPRFPSFDFRWLDNTADNSSAAGIRTSTPASPGGDPASWRIDFSDGSDSRQGEGAAAMGSPADAVAWLVGELANESSSLAPGDLVYTGGLAAPFDVEVGHRYTVRAEFGEASFVVVDE